MSQSARSEALSGDAGIWPEGFGATAVRPSRHHVVSAADLPPDMAYAVLDSLPVGVTVHAGDGGQLFSNRAAHALAASVSQAAGGNLNLDPAAALEVVTSEIAIGGQSLRVEVHFDVTEHRQIERELFDRAYLDDLTGLANRRFVEERTDELIQSIGSSEGFALAFIDIDNFKQINDCYSHAVGDLLLIKIAKRLCETVRSTDIVARIGGDEFVLLLSPVGADESLHELAERISERLKQPFFIDGREIFASASTGISLFPRHGRTYSVLRRNADSAMYCVKDGTKGGVAFFDESMEQTATARMATEQRLRQALRDQGFRCAYQPKIDIGDESIVGVEVLLRLREEADRSHAPNDFVGVAGELGMMNEITRLVLAETIDSLEEIDEAFGADASISVNVAARQAADVEFMRSFAGTLAETGCAHRFIVEITEEAFLATDRFQSEVLPLLRSAGARVSIDDFGVGFSSLASLADITADEVKIDRSFITQIHDRPRSQMILKAIESLGTTLGMSIVAEGVETAEELDYLRWHSGIRCVQGYYFSRPMFLGATGSAPFLAPKRPFAPGREHSIHRAAPLRGLLPSRT